MCRNSLPKDTVHIIGFYSNSGKVRASDKWGGEGKCKTLRNGF